MPVELVIQPAEDGASYRVWVDDGGAGAAPVQVACVAAFDDAYLLLYVLGNNPGTRELCADSPKLVASLDAHCGRRRH
jgi:hypothetical protein